MSQPASDGAPEPVAAPPRPVAAVALLARWWALAGGLLACALAVMTAGSAVSNLILHRPFPADYELVKHVVAIVIFMFLPYCQIAGANVTVDVFTEGILERSKAAMALLASLLAIAFAALLFRQMWLGWQSYMRFPETTPVLRLPLWTAFPPILLSIALLFAAAIVTAGDEWRRARGRPGWRLTPAAPVEPQP